jgi:hypothetical protein
MNILIVEDYVGVAKQLQKALIGLGVISICTADSRKKKRKMPPLGDTIKLIQESHIILLDYNLVDPSYNGQDLLKWCKGKIVVSTSNETALSELIFNQKHGLPDKVARDELRALISELVAKLETGTP